MQKVTAGEFLTPLGKRGSVYNYIVTSPGQGVQKPGMLDPWLTLPAARDRIAIWSDAVKFDLVTASRDENSLRDTAVAQPVIIATALLSLSVLREKVDISGDGTLFAGHSVGELAAGVGAGYLTDEAALTLAGVRGGAMSSACALAATGMAAVMPTKRGGASDDEIVAKTHEHGLSTANRNGCNQFVVAGPLDAVEHFADAPPEGMRVMKLDVAGAFHTSAMDTAISPFAEAVNSCPVSAPSSPMIGNSDGAIIEGPMDFKKRLIAQINSVVRWDLCAATIASAATADTVVIELAPSGPLTRLAERLNAEFQTVAIREPGDVELLSGEFAID